MYELNRISQDVIDNYMVRRTRKQKNTFIAFIEKSLSSHYSINTNESNCGIGKNRNIIIGDIENADIIYTAHYDTPRGLSIFGPHFISTSKLIKLIIKFYKTVKIVTSMLLMTFLFSILIYQFTGQDLYSNFNISYILSCMVLFLLVFTAPINKQNYNDNTSGVVTILETALRLQEQHKGIVAFVLFDNEEWGCKGSKKLLKKYRKKLQDKTVINFDCVCEGDSIVLSCKPTIFKDKQLYNNLKSYFASTQNKTVIFNDCTKLKVSASDHKYFNKSVGVIALKKGKGKSLYLSKIHTSKDTNFDIENIDLLVNASINLISKYENITVLKV